MRGVLAGGIIRCLRSTNILRSARVPWHNPLPKGECLVHEEIGSKDVMNKSAKWSDATAEEVLQMHDRGCRLAEICSKFGVVHSMVQQFLTANNRGRLPRAYITGAL